MFEDWLSLNSVNSSVPARIKANSLTTSSTVVDQQQQQKIKNNDSTIRIFISSTFSDMSRERDLIATRIAPRVNKFSEGLGITTSVIDMRWGVTAEQTQAHDTVSVCLDQVLKSDIMIVFCGHRYGWHVCDQHQQNQSSNNELLTKSILHAAESVSGVNWLQPVLENNHNSSNNRIGKFLLTSSVTELEIRTAFMKERSVLLKPSPSNIHVFLRNQSLKSETEDCEIAKSRLMTMRTALSLLPNTRKYENLARNNNTTTTTSAEQQQQYTSSSSSSSSAAVLKNANELEEEIFKAICESIYNVFPDRRARAKPRKWERETQIQQVLADRSLNGFCDDF